MKNKELDKIVLDCFNLQQKFLRNVSQEDLLRSVCNLDKILLNRKQRTYCLNRLAQKVKNAHKIDLETPKELFERVSKLKLKSYKVLIEVRAYNEADMREIVQQANDSEIEWWCCIGE